MRHQFQSAKSDGADATLVRPSNWNAVHVPSIADIAWVLEDFIGGSATHYGQMPWDSGNGTLTDIAGEANHPGILRMSTGATINAITRLRLDGGRGITYSTFGRIDNRAWTIEYVLRINQTVQFKQWLGLTSQWGHEEPPNGFFFRVVNGASAAHWYGVTRASDVETATDTGITADTNFHRFKIASDGAGNIAFYIDDGLCATNTTNLPTVLTCIPDLASKNTEAVDKSYDFDAMAFWMPVTR